MTGKKKSQKRQRTLQIKTPCTAHEFNAISAKADRAGLTRGAFLRAAGLGAPGPRSKRLLHPNETLLRQTLSECSRIGANLNQAIKKFHTTGTPPPDLQKTYAAIMALCDTITGAIGVPQKPSPETPDGHQGKKPD